MEIKIEKYVEIPSIEKSYRGSSPWPKMEVGDSFFIPVNSPSPEKVRIRYQVQGYYYYGTSAIVTRKVPGGFRFWRVK